MNNPVFVLQLAEVGGDFPERIAADDGVLFRYRRRTSVLAKN